MKKLSLIASALILSACGSSSSDDGSYVTEPVERDITFSASAMDLISSAAAGIEVNTDTPADYDGYTGVFTTVDSKRSVHYVRNTGYEICWFDELRVTTCEEFTLSLTEEMNHHIPRVVGQVSVWVQADIDTQDKAIGFSLTGSVTVPNAETELSMVLDNRDWAMLGVNNEPWIASTPTITFNGKSDLPMYGANANTDADTGFYHTYVNTAKSQTVTTEVTLTTSEVLTDTQDSIVANQNIVYTVSNPFDDSATITVGEYFQLPPVEICMNCDTPIDPVTPDGYFWADPTTVVDGVSIFNLVNDSGDVWLSDNDDTAEFKANFSEATANRKTIKEVNGEVVLKQHSYIYADGSGIIATNTPTESKIMIGGGFTIIAGVDNGDPVFSIEHAGQEVNISCRYAMYPQSQTHDLCEWQSANMSDSALVMVRPDIVKNHDHSVWGTSYATEWANTYLATQGESIDYGSID